MSRVFVAEETSLGRTVVVKVLPPDLAATVNVERFRRENVQVSDLGFALTNALRDFPSADSSRIGAVGMSMGGIYTTLLALRNSAIRVVIGRDPSFVSTFPSYFSAYWATPDFDAARFRGHMLVLHKHELNPRTRVVDSLRFADRVLIRLPYVVG